ncbi:MAG TPA: hypothetical protein VHF22_05615 [Planctomycetota bacterium]|nr:hypothetical protein [Planctomycetota bacterium]
MTRPRRAAGAAAARRHGAGACAAAPPVAAPRGDAILIVNTELVDQGYGGADAPVVEHRPVLIYAADGQLRERLAGWRDAPWTTLAPGRYVVVTEVDGARRSVPVELAAGQRRLVRFSELLAGDRTDG